jgi:hypothetical protein
MRPQLDLLIELIEDVARTRPLGHDLSAETAARLIHSLVLAAVHARVFGTDGAADVPARAIWQFCASGIGSPIESPGTPQGRTASGARRSRGGRAAATTKRKQR